MISSEREEIGYLSIKNTSNSALFKIQWSQKALSLELFIHKFSVESSIFQNHSSEKLHMSDDAFQGFSRSDILFNDQENLEQYLKSPFCTTLLVSNVFQRINVLFVLFILDIIKFLSTSLMLTMTFSTGEPVPYHHYGKFTCQNIVENPPWSS